MKIQDFFRITLIGILVVLWNCNLFGGAGDLDSNFDGDGKVNTDFAGSADLAKTIAIQPDGKLVVGGGAFSGGTSFGIARYNPDGSLDNSFSSDGRVITDFASGADLVGSVAIQSDGKIVAAGRATVGGVSVFALARYNPDGSLDSTFDGDGKVTTDFGGLNVVGTSMVLQNDGKIIVVGFTVVNSTSADFALARYNTDGSLDTSFSFDGKVITDFSGNPDDANAVVIQTDGKIVVAGSSFTGTTTDFALARYNSNGVLDNSFDFDGKVTTDFNLSSDVLNDIIVQSDGKLVVGGHKFDSTIDFALARYNSNGSLDTTFDFDGKVITDFDGNLDEVFGLALQSDGKIIAAGEVQIGGSSGSFADFGLARYNSNGSLDNSFNIDGKIITDFSGSLDRAFDVLIQPDSKIVAAGQSFDTSFDFAIVRYDSDPPPTGIFSDDYEDGILASDWTYVKQNWTESAGNLTGTPAGKSAEVIANPAFGGCSVCNMEASIQTAGGPGNKLWFLTWFVDKRNTVEVLMKEENDKWILRQRVNGSIVAKTKGIATILPNVFYDVRVTFDGVNFGLFVDGVSLATLPAVAAPNGTLGFRVKKTTGRFGFVIVN